MKRTSGFTLIELVAVVAILVVLASLVIPRIDALQTKTNKGVSASNQHAVTRSIMLYKTMHNSYPETWDSLLTGPSGGLWQAAAPTGTGLEPQLTGGFSSFPGAFAAKLTTAPLNAEMIESMSRTGLTGVVDLTSPGSPPSAFGGTARAFVVGENVAIVNSTDVTAADSPTNDGDAKGIWREAFPGKTDAEILGFQGQGKLVVLGVGPSNKMVGDNLLTTPTYTNVDPAHYYNRFLAVFYVRDNAAKRAFLRTVLAADGDRLSEEIGDFYEVDE